MDRTAHGGRVVANMSFWVNSSVTIFLERAIIAGGSAFPAIPCPDAKSIKVHLAGQTQPPVVGQSAVNVEPHTSSVTGITYNRQVVPLAVAEVDPSYWTANRID
jgi:hypothetical protein